MIRQVLLQLSEKLVPLIDIIALIFIVFGPIQACFAIAKVMLASGNEQQTARAVWMQYSRWLVAGLTFQLALTS